MLLNLTSESLLSKLESLLLLEDLLEALEPLVCLFEVADFFLAAAAFLAVIAVALGPRLVASLVGPEAVLAGVFLIVTSSSESLLSLKMLLYFDGDESALGPPESPALPDKLFPAAPAPVGVAEGVMTGLGVLLADEDDAVLAMLEAAFLAFALAEKLERVNPPKSESESLSLRACFLAVSLEGEFGSGLAMADFLGATFRVWLSLFDDDFLDLFELDFFAGVSVSEAEEALRRVTAPVDEEGRLDLPFLDFFGDFMPELEAADPADEARRERFEVRDRREV